MKINDLMVRDIFNSFGNFFFLMEDSTVYSFGPNKNNELGLSTSGPVTYPQKIEGLLDVKEIVAGYMATFFILKNGIVFSCGRGETGILGLKRKELFRSLIVPEPRLIIFPDEGVETVLKISTSKSHTLFLTDMGVFGSGEFICKETGSSDSCFLVPILLSDNKDIVEVQASRFVSFFLDAKGDVYSCGSSCYGLTGQGVIDDDFSKPVKIRNLRNIIKISANEKHAIFLDKKGQVWACGDFRLGKCGIDEDFYNDVYNSIGDVSFGIATPTKIEIPKNEEIKDIFTGEDNTFLITKNGEVLSFGQGSLEILEEKSPSHDNPKKLYTPKKISKFKGIKKVIPATNNFSLFVTNLNNIYYSGSFEDFVPEIAVLNNKTQIPRKLFIG